MSATKRRAPVPNPASILKHAVASSSANKRQRRDDGSASAALASESAGQPAHDDPELEEQDRKRLQQGRKGRLITSGYESESSDEDDGAAHRRKAQRRSDKRTKVADGDDGHHDEDDDDDDDDDMFAAEDAQGAAARAHGDDAKKQPRFLRLGEIEGQEFSSKSREKGQESGDDDNDDPTHARQRHEDDEEQDPDLELEDSDDDDDQEVTDLNALGERTPPTSPGGTPLRAAQLGRKGKAKAGNKRGRGNAVKITGFNMKDEMQTGRFDEDGNYIENSRDPHADHDVWLAGNYSRSKIRAAREAQQKRERELQEKEAQAQTEDNDEDDVKKQIVEYMARGESVLGTLQRLGAQTKAQKASRSSQRRTSKQTKGAADTSRPSVDMDVDWQGRPAPQATSLPKSQAVKELEHVTHLSSVLLSRFGQVDIYEQTYEALLQDVRKSGLVRGNFDPAARFDKSTTAAPIAGEGQGAADTQATHVDASVAGRQWEYRWSPAYLADAANASGGAVAPDIEIFGPYSEDDIKAWSAEGYFGDSGERILLRPTGTKDRWQSFKDSLGT